MTGVSGIRRGIGLLLIACVGGALLPAAALGFALSSSLKERVSPDHLRVGIFIVSSVAAAALLGRAAFG